MNQYELNLKSERLELRVSPIDKKTIERLAKRLKLSKSELIRLAINSMNQRELIEIDMLPLRTATFELMKQGNNLNQLMYFLNAHSSNCTKNDIENVRYTLRKEGQILDKLLEAFDRINEMAKQHKVSLTNKDVDISEYDVLTSDRIPEQ